MSGDRAHIYIYVLVTIIEQLYTNKLTNYRKFHNTYPTLLTINNHSPYHTMQFPGITHPASQKLTDDGSDLLFGDPVGDVKRLIHHCTDKMVV